MGHAGLSLGRGFSRSVHRGTTCMGERHHEAVPLPRYYELHSMLPEGPGPRESYCQPEGPSWTDLQRRMEARHDGRNFQKQGSRSWSYVHVSEAKTCPYEGSVKTGL